MSDETEDSRLQSPLVKVAAGLLVTAGSLAASLALVHASREIVWSVLLLVPVVLIGLLFGLVAGAIAGFSLSFLVGLIESAFGLDVVVDVWQLAAAAVVVGFIGGSIGRVSALSRARNSLLRQMRALSAAAERQESTLRESEERYRGIFENSAFSLWEEDISELRARLKELQAEGVEDLRAYLDEHPELVEAAVDMIKAVNVNETTLRLYEARSKAELLGRLRTTLNMDDPVLIASLKASIVAISEGNVYFETESSAVTLTGKPLRIAITCYVPGETTVYPYMLVNVLDITERKEAEERIREQAQLLDIASDAICVRDLGGRILYWNSSAEKCFGWTKQEAIGLGAAEVFNFRRDGGEIDALRAVLERGEWSGELHPTSRAGLELVVEASLTLVRDERGDPKGILWVSTDVTERKAIRDQLMRAQRLESIGTLAGGIAHDLNNILTPILGGAETLSLQCPGEEAQKILDIMKASAQRGANIVRQVLSFARGAEVEPGRARVDYVVREIDGLIRETFPKSIDLRVDIPKDAWPVVGSVTQLHQVLMNLCLNARDAMPRGGTLRLSARNLRHDEIGARAHLGARAGRYVALAVEDSGAGMAPEVLEKIFDPFFTTKEPGRGTGLGLSTAMSIVRGLGGFIDVRSAVGKGSSFAVYLPAAEETVAISAASSGGLDQGQGELVLVVDDEEAVRDVTRSILESCGYRVLVAEDGEQALALHREKGNEIRATLIDMVMPNLDGPSTIRAIRRLDPGARIVAMGGLVHSATGELREQGVEAFLKKPYTAELLSRTLHDEIHRGEGSSGR